MSLFASGLRSEHSSPPCSCLAGTDGKPSSRASDMRSLCTATPRDPQGEGMHAAELGITLRGLGRFFCASLASLLLVTIAALSCPRRLYGALSAVLSGTGCVHSMDMGSHVLRDRGSSSSYFTSLPEGASVVGDSVRKHYLRSLDESAGSMFGRSPGIDQCRCGLSRFSLSCSLLGNRGVRWLARR